MQTYEEKWNRLKRRLEELSKTYKANEQINYVTYGSKAVDVIQDTMKELEGGRI